MWLASIADGNATCMLCDWQRGCVDEREAELEVRLHLEQAHNRIMVSISERRGRKGRTTWELHGPTYKHDLGQRK